MPTEDIPIHDLDCVPDWPEELEAEALDNIRTCFNALDIDELAHLALTLAKYDKRLPFARPLVEAITKLGELRYDAKYPKPKED